MKNFDINSIKKNKNEFKIPENYFENIDDIILSKYNAGKTTNTRKIYRINKNIYVGIAASVTLLLGVFFLYENFSKKTFDNVDIDDYLYAYYPSFSTEMIQDIDYEKLKILEDTLTPDINQIDEYLLNNTDIEYLMED